MRDWSINLPCWTLQLGYKLEGGLGTYDDLYLYKGLKLVKRWGWLEQVPDIYEIEEFIRNWEST